MSIQTSPTVFTPSTRSQRDAAAVAVPAAAPVPAARPAAAPRPSVFARLRHGLREAWRRAAAIDDEVNRRRDEAFLLYYSHTGR